MLMFYLKFKPEKSKYRQKNNNCNVFPLLILASVVSPHIFFFQLKGYGAGMNKGVGINGKFISVHFVSKFGEIDSLAHSLVA